MVRPVRAAWWFWVNGDGLGEKNRGSRRKGKEKKRREGEESCSLFLSSLCSELATAEEEEKRKGRTKKKKKEKEGRVKEG